MRGGSDASPTSDDRESAGPRRLALCAGLVVLMLFLAAPAAQAAFGVKSFTAGVLWQNPAGQPACQYAAASANPSLYATVAGSHPYCGFTSFTMNSTTGLLGQVPDDTLKDVRVDLPPGLVPNPQAVPRCTSANPGSLPGRGPRWARRS